MLIKENILLAQYTTLNLGGPARYFCSCTTVNELKEAVGFARSKNIRAHMLAGGSNTIFSDAGFDGLIVKVDLRGISFTADGDEVLAAVQAGEDWESFVALCVEKGYGGIECLSGIPGSVGATPIQNVGAYGQEVSDTIVSVTVLEQESLTQQTFSNADCSFGYRQSRFKQHDQGKYIITGVTFRLKKNGRPTIHYPEVKKVVESTIPLASLAAGRESLEAVRNVVLQLRRKKSMVIDPHDPNTRSVGSFFMNPVLSDEQFAMISFQWNSGGDGTVMPTFPTEGKTKIPAAWLIEKSGFHKGYAKNGVGISDNHTLALVNKRGTAAALLALAVEIQFAVQQRFGILLEMEPNIIS